MGGKSYYCDYCDCFMKNDINVRKAHNIGMSHNIAKANYLQKFKDPQQILNEETKKIPCNRLLNNQECHFGFFCHYSHYSTEELTYIQWIVDKSQHPGEQKINEADHAAHSLPWKYPNERKNFHFHHLPPSLQPIDFNKVNESCFRNQWG